MPLSPAAATFDKPLTSVTARHVLDFDPKRDGFVFTNLFGWTDDDLDYLTHELRPLLRGATVVLPAAAGAALSGKKGGLRGAGFGAVAAALRLTDGLVTMLARRWSTFGLCGGMALAAAERWSRAGGLPTGKLERDAIRALLRRQQARTLRASWSEFARWWLRALAARGEPLQAADALQTSLDRIRQQLDEGQPVVVGLAGDAPDPFALHQVVAFGYEMVDRRTTLFVYDPNAPGQTRHLRAWIESDRAHVTTDLPTGPRKDGRVHIHRTPGRVAMLFPIAPDGA